MDINTQAVTPPKQIVGNSLLGREEGYECTVKGHCYNELRLLCPKSVKVDLPHSVFVSIFHWILISKSPTISNYEDQHKENCRCTETQRDPYEDLVVDHQRLKL